MASNIGDIICFADESRPWLQANNVQRKNAEVTREQILDANEQHQSANRNALAQIFGCSEQKSQPRLERTTYVRAQKFYQHEVHRLVAGALGGRSSPLTVRRKDLA